MNLFKNGVGRPSNEIIKKRRTFYVIVICVIVLVLGLGTYLLTNINSSSKLKGALTSEQLKIDFTKINGNGTITIHDNQRGVGNLSSRLAYAYDKNAAFTVNITNNTDTLKYYQIYYHSTTSSESALNKNTFDSKSSCFIVSPRRTSGFSHSVSLDSNKPIKIVIAKGFATMDLCKNDSYGTVANDNAVSRQLNIGYEPYMEEIVYRDSLNVIGYEYVKLNSKTTVKEPKISESQLKNLNGWGITSWKLSCNGKKYKVGNTISTADCIFPELTAMGNKTSKFTVKYNKNGGTGYMIDKKITYGKSTALSTNLFVRSGYKFNGWVAVRKSDGYTYGYNSKGKVGWYEKPTTKYVYKNKQKISQTVVAGQTVTMYAQWKKR